MKRILLVEDDVHVQSIMVKGLCDDGYEVITASNAIEAVSFLSDTHKSEPDIVFMDVPICIPDSLELVGRVLKFGMGKPLILHWPELGYDVHLIMLAGAITMREFNDLARLKTKLKNLLYSHEKGYLPENIYLN